MAESHVEQQVAERIAAARRREAEKQQQRAEFAAARAAGVAKRHAQKLYRQTHAEQQHTEDLMPAALRPAVCPSCRCERPARLVTTVVVSGARHDVVRCPITACELMWLVRANRPSTAPVAA